MLGKDYLTFAAVVFMFSGSGTIYACDDYSLTEEESRYLKSVKIELQIPAMPFADDPPLDNESAPKEKNCFLRSDFNGDGVLDFAGIHQNSRHPGKGHRWAFDLVLVYSDNGEIRHRVFPGSGRADMDKELMHHFLVQQPPGIIDLRPSEVEIVHPGILSYRYGEPAVLYYWNRDRFTLRKFFVDD